MSSRPAHWVSLEIPEDNGDPRLLDACWALMDVVAIAPADVVETHVLDSDPDLGDLPLTHNEGTPQDQITFVAVVRLAKAVLAVADSHEFDLGAAHEPSSEPEPYWSPAPSEEAWHQAMQDVADYEAEMTPRPIGPNQYALGGATLTVSCTLGKVSAAEEEVEL